MTLSRLPSGRWTAKVWVNSQDHRVNQVLGLPRGTTWATKRDARTAREKARVLLEGATGHDLTVGAWWERWTTDPRFQRPKQSTDKHNHERTRAFAQRYETVQLRNVTRFLVDEWLRDPTRNGTIPALRAMFNDAIRVEACDRNPFEKLGISKTRGNRDVRPPDQRTVRELIDTAARIAGPSFAAWLQVAAFTGMRPGELDALRWDAIDFDRNRIQVLEQFSAGSRSFTLPKNGRRREAPLTPPAREALLSLPRESEFCFTTLRGSHWTPAARAYHWKAVKAAVGYNDSLYVATRHHAGNYMTNELELPAEDVAIALGHTDGGYLVRTLYGHRDEQRALDRVLAAYEDRSNVVQLPKREETA